MKLLRRMGGWRRVEKYRGRGRVDGSELPEQSVEYQVEVWEQFIEGRGGRYKIEGRVELEAPPEVETAATLILEKDIRLRIRVLPGGLVLGDSAPQFPTS